MRAVKKPTVAERRAEILEITCEVVIERGFAATRIADVAKRLGVSSSLIHYHFDSKEQLLAEAQALGFAQCHGMTCAPARQHRHDFTDRRFGTRMGNLLPVDSGRLTYPGEIEYIEILHVIALSPYGGCRRADNPTR